MNGSGLEIFMSYVGDEILGSNWLRLGRVRRWPSFSRSFWGAHSSFVSITERSFSLSGWRFSGWTTCGSKHYRKLGYKYWRIALWIWFVFDPEKIADFIDSFDKWITFRSIFQGVDMNSCQLPASMLRRASFVAQSNAWVSLQRLMGFTEASEDGWVPYSMLHHGSYFKRKVENVAVDKAGRRRFSLSSHEMQLGWGFIALNRIISHS